MSNKKLFSMICMLLLMMTPTISIISAEETMDAQIPILDKMVFARIKIDGNGFLNVNL